jgi:hypothetical protein
MVHTDLNTLELPSQLKLCELRNQTTCIQLLPYRSWFARFRCWIQTNPRCRIS